MIARGRFVVAVHGGAGEVKTERERLVEKGVRESVLAGSSLLKRNGRALDAVEECIKILEDNPIFNAGTGSVLTMTGTVEMDASISDGSNLNSGAVALISNIRHPVSLARVIMEKTDHVLIVGKSAEKLGEKFGLETRDPKIAERVELWKEARRKFEKGELKHLQKTMVLMKMFPDLTETVGAVAIDTQGDIAAATSTGGLMLKLPGRMGDTPIIGAGNYADNESGAASCTGIGEVALRLCLAKTACDYMRAGSNAQEAAAKCIELTKTRQAGLDMGLIAIDKNYNYGLFHNTRNLVWALQTEEMKEPRSGLRYPSK